MDLKPRAAVLEMPAYRPGRTGAELRGSGRTPEELIRLASNESPFGPLPEVVQALEAGIADINRYPDPGGSLLRGRIASAHGLPADHVTIGAGSVGLLWQLAQVFLDADTELVAPWPSFEGYPIAAALMGSRFVGVGLDPRGVLDPADLIAAVSDDTRLVVLAEPNNPTGTTVGFAAVEQLAQQTAGRCVLVVDEAYIDFDPDGDPVRSAELVRRFPHVVVLRTFSKAHGLAGLRVGYALADPGLIGLIDRVAPPFAVSSLAQRAAVASLDALGSLEARLDVIRRERDRIVEGLGAIGVDAVGAATNFVWIPRPDADAETVAEQLEQLGLITRPIAGQGLRVTIGSCVDNDSLLAGCRTVLADPHQRPPITEPQPDHGGIHARAT